MASRHHVTLVASTVATVSTGLTGKRVAVTNLDGVAAVYFRAGDTGVASPTVAGNDTFAVPANAGSFRAVELSGPTDAVTVRLISSGTPTVAVELVDDEWGNSPVRG